MNSSGYTTIVKGNSPFIRNVGLPISDAIDQALADSEFEYQDDRREELLQLDESIMADAATGAVVGVLCFLGKWAAQKFLDEIYTLKIQPKLQECLSALKTSAEDRAKPKEKTFVFGIWLPELSSLVMARIKGKNFAEIGDLLGQAQAALALGAATALKARITKEVHVYSVRQQMPEVYQSLSAALGKSVIAGGNPTLYWRSGDGYSVQIGYMNDHGQLCCGHCGVPGNLHNQLAYKVECTLCGYVYGANGADLHERRCPKCQDGSPGIRFWQKRPSASRVLGE